MKYWNRRELLQGIGAASAAAWLPPSADALGLPDDKIKVIRYFSHGGDSQGRPGQPMVNQSSRVVMVETENGLIGWGEGGEPTTMDECASMLIGQDPFRTEIHWQTLMRGMHYTAGREKLHSIGALDLALWDLKARALDVPVWQLLGGKARDHVECYATAFPGGGFGSSLADRAKACVDAGIRVYRHATDNPRQRVVDRFELVRQMHKDALEIHGAVGDGHWALDFHTELDAADAINLATLIEPLHPYFAEDLIRSESIESYEHIRNHVRVPIAVGEQFGYKWDVNRLIEKELIDYVRSQLPNTGGITEYMKIMALAETHYIGLIPHFTGPIAEAALVHCLTASSSVALMEMLGDGSRTYPHLTDMYDFRDGKFWPNDRPGLGVTVNVDALTLIAEYTEYRAGMLLNRRPDGSYMQW
ncbi:MAG: mandelate racemase/muconate lactonizing enzyme family protein [Pseudomonadota bacterium]|nr:mandelate racemase/muconate lactonizing enzyme family protein [Pseudomonadota bacterium]